MGGMGLDDQEEEEEEEEEVVEGYFRFIVFFSTIHLLIFSSFPYVDIVE